MKRENGESLIFIMFTKLRHYILDLCIYTCLWDSQYSKKIKGKGKITVQYLTPPPQASSLVHSSSVNCDNLALIPWKREKGESLIFIMFTKLLHYILDLYIYIYMLMGPKIQ